MTNEAPVLQGTPVVPGVGYGPVIRPAPRPQITTSSDVVPDTAREAEVARFDAAVEEVAGRLRARAARASGAAAEVLQANAVLVEDRAWRAAVDGKIRAGSDAVAATVGATDQFVTIFEKIGGLQAERVTDLVDIRDRVLAELNGEPEPGIDTPDVPSVLLADDLAPADTAALDPVLVVAIATKLGGPTSHTAIIARQLGIPCVVAMAGIDDIESGTSVMVDGGTGRLVVEPDHENAEAVIAKDRADRARIAMWAGPGQTSDAQPIAILANVQDGAGARTARSTPAEGVGLFRTELCFLDRDTEPTVDEQIDIYSEVFEAYQAERSCSAPSMRVPTSHCGSQIIRTNTTPRSVSEASASPPRPRESSNGNSMRSRPPRCAPVRRRG